jgi:hypothetical protein
MAKKRESVGGTVEARTERNRVRVLRDHADAAGTDQSETRSVTEQLLLTD